METVILIQAWTHPDTGDRLEAVNIQVFVEDASPDKVYLVFELKWQGKKLDGLWSCWLPKNLKEVSLTPSGWNPITPWLSPSSDLYESPMEIDPCWLSNWIANGALKQIIQEGKM